jgi:hypothetical protein
MSGNGLGYVAPVQKGNGKSHILADYSEQRYRLRDTSYTRCGKYAGQWTRLDDANCLDYASDPNSCATCVRMLADD